MQGFPLQDDVHFFHGEHHSTGNKDFEDAAAMPARHMVPSSMQHQVHPCSYDVKPETGFLLKCTD